MKLMAEQHRLEHDHANDDDDGGMGLMCDAHGLVVNSLTNVGDVILQNLCNFDIHSSHNSKCQLLAMTSNTFELFRS
jgi:hypothetical protein